MSKYSAFPLVPLLIKPIFLFDKYMDLILCQFA